jgi:caffeoyl-CoA O-methyltransferase
VSNRPTLLTDDLHDYLQQQGYREPDILVRLREETATDKMAIMQITPEQGALMALLTELLGVKRYLEVGVFTGYSALAVGLALPGDGRITALDKSEEWTSVARRYWQEAGIDDRVDLRMGDAVDSLRQLVAEGASGLYDFAFIDGAKPDYDTYYELCLELIKPGGLIGIDNTFYMGGVLPSDDRSESSDVVDALNRKIKEDNRVSIAMLPIGDGLMLCRKRP